MKINICYASDENYVMPLSVSLYSFLEHHQEIEQILIHILGNKITHDSQEKIKEIALEFNRELTFYDLSEKLESIYLQNNIPNTIAITSYSRLFIDEFLPAKLEGTLLYVDCDTLFLGGIDKIIAHPQEKIIEGVKIMYLAMQEMRLVLIQMIFISMQAFSKLIFKNGKSLKP